MGVLWSMLKSALFATAKTGADENAPSAAAGNGAEVTPYSQTQQTDSDKLVAPYSRSFNRTLISTMLESHDGGVYAVGKTITIGGWVRAGRKADAGSIAFLDINDGTTALSLQAKVPLEIAEEVGGFSRLMPSGTFVLLQGNKVELSVSKVKLLGGCDNSAGKYPLAKKKMTLEYLRSVMHLRGRTSIIGAATRIGHTLSVAIHNFFDSHGFFDLRTPHMTTSDCEGAGEMFQVTTLLSRAENYQAEEIVSADMIARLKGEVSVQAELVLQLVKDFEADKQNSELQKRRDTEKNKLQHLAGQLVALEKQADVQRRTVEGILRTPEGGIDYGLDFCHRPLFLPVSGQLHAECYACALSYVYAFGPAFRAERSYTSRHLAELWMVEPELALAKLEDIMNLASDLVQHCFKELLEKRWTDLELLTKMVDSGLIERLRMVATTPFARCTYTEAIKLLEAAVEGGKKFEFPVRWGIDMASEHERYLAEEIFKKPTMVYNHPKGIKAFYMRLNDDGETVASLDVLVPGIGELIGGSEREDRLDVLEARMNAAGMDKEQYRPYLNLREYGSVPHSGFGMGLDRLIMFATGLNNIRDTIPFPCTPGHAPL